MEFIPHSSAPGSSGREQMADRLQGFADLAAAKVTELQETTKDKDMQLLFSGANAIVGTLKLVAGSSPKFKEYFGGIKDRGVLFLIRGISNLLIQQARTAPAVSLWKLSAILDQASAAIREAIANELQDQG